ncbi:hypothetical protein [Taklimakanibacter lacteus]|uniref:hypothetical protein n=1 Tax=Taklimakanibacter lacteus TaxID=2268456 RepID=UPI000E660FCF
MMDFLTHIHDLLTRAPPISGGQWLFLLLLLGVATIIFNIVTNTSELPQMALNFLFLLVGARLGMILFPNLSPPLDVMANATLAVFSGMVGAALVNMAFFRSS